MTKDAVPVFQSLVHTLTNFYNHHKNSVLVLEIIGLLYVLLGLAYITNSYLMRNNQYYFYNELIYEHY